MSCGRFVLSAAVAGVVVGACGSGGDDEGGSPGRNAPVITADIVAPRGESQPQYYQRQVLLINKWIRQVGPPPRSSAPIIEIVRQAREESGKFATMAPYDLGDGARHLAQRRHAEGPGSASRGLS